jgi:hypothetical protein
MQTPLIMQTVSIMHLSPIMDVSLGALWAPGG